MNCIKSGIYGQIVGDALGLPVQFISRDKRDLDPVSDMRGHGAFDMPAGSWSDDSSLILATMDGLTKSLEKENIDNDSKDLLLNDIIDYEIIMKNFSNWLKDGQFTPYGFAYDVGGATMEGIYRYDDGCEPIKSGGIGERDNGNGSLMRILPIAFFIYSLSKKYSFSEDDKMEAVHNLSSLTHRHRRSQMTCGIYVTIALEFIENYEKECNLSLEELIANGINKSREYYENNTSFEKELHHFERVFSLNIQNLPRDEIKSGGYTISSLEASIWCLLNNENYKDTVLQAVNLGYDTDTTACIVGGLAGIHYGYDDIPADWINQLVRLDYIEELIDNFNNILNKDFFNWGDMMYDLKKLEEKFHEFLKDGINENEFDIDGIEITEELLEQQEAFLIHFGYLSYFLVIEDEKPVIYVNVATRMDTDSICFVDEEGYKCYDVFFGDHKDISEKYYSQLRKIKRYSDIKDIHF